MASSTTMPKSGPPARSPFSNSLDEPLLRGAANSSHTSDEDCAVGRGTQIYTPQSQSPTSSTSEGPPLSAEVSRFLQEAGLEKFQNMFRNLGWCSMTEVAKLNIPKLKSADMDKNDIARFRDAIDIRELREQKRDPIASPPAASAAIPQNEWIPENSWGRMIRRPDWSVLATLVLIAIIVFGTNGTNQEDVDLKKGWAALRKANQSLIQKQDELKMANESNIKTEQSLKQEAKHLRQVLLKDLADTEKANQSILEAEKGLLRKKSELEKANESNVGIEQNLLREQAELKKANESNVEIEEKLHQKQAELKKEAKQLSLRDRTLRNDRADIAKANQSNFEAQQSLLREKFELEKANESNVAIKKGLVQKQTELEKEAKQLQLDDQALKQKKGEVAKAQKAVIASEKRLRQQKSELEKEIEYESDQPQAWKQKTLLAAAKNKDWPVVHILLQAGAEVDGADEQGMTPLHYAASRDYLLVAKCLIEEGIPSAMLTAEVFEEQRKNPSVQTVSFNRIGSKKQRIERYQ